MSLDEFYPIAGLLLAVLSLLGGILVCMKLEQLATGRAEP